VRNPLDQIATLRSYANKIGWPAALRLRAFDLRSRAGVGVPVSIALKVKNADFPLCIRSGSSDRQVLWQVFVEGEYESAGRLCPQTIIDLGANVGYSSAYFLSTQPDAKVLAVEPDPGNYAACCRNLEPFGSRAKVVHGAVWAQPAKLLLERGTYRDGREWTTQVRPAADTDVAIASDHVEGYDMDTLILMSGFSRVDLLKIDIERSEIQLFSRNTEHWLPLVKNLFIELHDRDCEEVFFRALSKYSYSLSHAGDVTICSDLRMLSL
jgi:FkbM family methyltransferase